MPGTAKGPTFFLHYPTSCKGQALILFTPVPGGCIHLGYQIPDFDSKLWEYCQELLPSVLQVSLTEMHFFLRSFISQCWKDWKQQMSGQLPIKLIKGNNPKHHIWVSWECCLQ